MKRFLSLLSFLTLFIAWSYADPVARIFAYDLRLTTEGDNYTFSFKANEAPTEASLVFYSIGTGKIIGEKALVGIVKGANSVTLNRNELAGGGTMNWGVKLHAGAIENFEVIHTGTDLKKCHLTIDNSPESDYFGRIYIANRQGSASGGIYVYNQDYSVHTSNTLAGQTEWESMGRPAVGADGTVYLADWGDSHGGIYVMNPATLTATNFFVGSQASSGLWTNASDNAMGSSTASVGVYGSGTNTVLYAMNEDVSSAGTTLYAHGVNVYQIGQPDGSVKTSWNAIPTRTFALSDNAAQMFVINATSKGAFFSCSRAKPNNTSDARSLQFYNTSGTRKYVALPEGATADLTGSLGGGCAVSRDEKTLAIVDGDGNILVYSIAWTGDVPALTKVTKYTTSYAALGSLCFDYAGNILVTAGANYNNSTANKMVVYTVPTTDNTCTVPAKKALTVYGPMAGIFDIGGDNAAFTSLASAMDTLEHYGLKGDVKFRICADLTENKNIGIANNTNHRITICPDGTTKRTVTFTGPDNGGPSGNIVIGCTTATLGLPTVKDVADPSWYASTAKNIFIDGSYEDDGQYLEFRGSTAGGRVVVFYGHVTNSIVRNCRLINPRTSGGATYAVEFRTEQLGMETLSSTPLRAAFKTDNAPDGIGIENCYIQVTGVSNAQTIVFNGASRITNTGRIKDCYIKDCEIVSNLRGVFLNGANNATFEGNTFRFTAASAGFLAHGIMGNDQAGTIIVRGNKFVENKSTNTNDGAYGLQTITASGGATKWIIENNYFDGMDATKAGVVGESVQHTYVRCGDYCEVRHNTFVMPSFSNNPGTALVASQAISCLWLAGSHEYPVENNLFVSEETTANNSLIRGSLNANVKGNVFYHAGGNAYIVAGAASAQAFNNLASSYQSTNKWQQVAFETGSYRITDDYANNINLGVERIEGLNTDIEGNTRNFPTRAGCYDPAWSITLDQTANNDAVLTDFNTVMVDATLKRPFTADGGWYTLVLPFDVTAAQLAEAFGAGTEVAVLQDSHWKSADEMYLNFRKQATIEAGVPFLIKPTETIASEVTFSDVTIDKTPQDIETDLVNMIGFYKPTTITLDDDNYYLGNSDLLYEYNTEYASDYATPNGFRAYFHFDFTPPAGCAARVVFHEDTATGIDDLPATAAPAAEKVIRDGQLLIIRDGKEYNAQGQLVR